MRLPWWRDQVMPVRSVRRWEVGDEPAGACVDGVRVTDAESP